MFSAKLRNSYLLLFLFTQNYGTSDKEPACQCRRCVRNVGSVSGLGRSPGRLHSNALQCSCLENLKDRGAWRVTVHRVAKSRTQLKQLGTCSTHLLYPYYPENSASTALLSYNHHPQLLPSKLHQNYFYLFFISHDEREIFKYVVWYQCVVCSTSTHQYWCVVPGFNKYFLNK